MTVTNVEKIDLIVYTCVTGNYDWVFSPIWNRAGVKFICFTDNLKLKDPIWDFRAMPKECDGFDHTAANRFCKFFPWKILPPHTWSIYMDANVRLLSDPSPVIEIAKKTGQISQSQCIPLGRTRGRRVWHV
jgi:hypothetical protein